MVWRVGDHQNGPGVAIYSPFPSKRTGKELSRERTKQEKNTFRPAACRQVPDISAEFQGIYEIHQQLLRKVLKVEIEGKGNNYYPTQR